jgi:hypothetical protein
MHELLEALLLFGPSALGLVVALSLAARLLDRGDASDG